MNLLQVTELKKSYARGFIPKRVNVLKGLSFAVPAGTVTGFLGPNGAGKTTTMRCILGLDAPSSGTVTVGGRAYRDLPAPLREVGALIDPGAVHPKRSAYNHLLALAQSNGIPAKRVDDV